MFFILLSWSDAEFYIFNSPGTTDCVNKCHFFPYYAFSYSMQLKIAVSSGVFEKFSLMGVEYFQNWIKEGDNEFCFYIGIFCYKQSECILGQIGIKLEKLKAYYLVEYFPALLCSIPILQYLLLQSFPLKNGEVLEVDLTVDKRLS